MAWVLVVDDDQATCESLRVLLEEFGYAVAEAPDGQYALDMLRSTPYRVVVLFDVLMPILNGIEFIKQVCDDDALKERHAFILMTADMSTINRLTEEQHGCLSAIVRKPFDIDNLVGLVRQAADRLPKDA
jgi:two-component system, NtrC family, response regulator HydG